jgi:hypothetical protein
MKAIMVYHHLGLGDHIVSNGLVRHVLDDLKPSRLFLPTKVHNYNTVARMYWDRAEVVPCLVKTDQDVPMLPQIPLCDGILQVGFSRVRDDWDVSFYDTNGMPFEYRWSKFKIVRDENREYAIRQKLGIGIDEKFVLIHNKGSNCEYDLKIQSDHRKVFVQPITDCMLDWCELAESAEEVHCIDSSFVHLAQSLNVKRGVFHNIRTMNTSFSLKNSWKTVDYRNENTND